MDKINATKNKILKGEDIAENYKALTGMVNNKKKEISTLKTKLSKEYNKKSKCVNIQDIQEKIDIINNKDILDDDFIIVYRDIMSNINYLEDYYKSNQTIIKKIDIEGSKVTLNKIK